MTTLEEDIARLSFERQKIVRIMQGRDFDVARTRQPGRRPVWKFSYDQGVGKGSNVYPVRQDDISPLWCINTLQSEGFDFKDRLNAELFNVLYNLFPEA